MLRLLIIVLVLLWLLGLLGPSPLHLGNNLTTIVIVIIAILVLFG